VLLHTVFRHVAIAFAGRYIIEGLKFLCKLVVQEAYYGVWV
jgi:hypothetical protein